MKNKYSIYSSETDKSKELIKKFDALIDKNKWEYDEKDFEYLFIFGGDGSLLRRVQNYVDKDIKIIVINGGTFGFFSSFSLDNIDTLFDHIQKSENYINPLMLKLKSSKQTWYALNEIVVSSNHLIKIQININNDKYELFRGSGLLFTTQFGSTGRNRSAGGPVIFPNNNVYSMVELEPVNQKEYNTLNSPIVIDKKTKFNISVKSFVNSIELICDGNKHIFYENMDFEIETIDPKFKLYYPTTIEEYIKKLQCKFISTE